LAAARDRLPGGQAARAAFDTALNLAKGKNIGEAALAAARDRLPGGPAARAAFDAAVALGQGRRLQERSLCSGRAGLACVSLCNQRVIFRQTRRKRTRTSSMRLCRRPASAWCVRSAPAPPCCRRPAERRSAGSARPLPALSAGGGSTS
jgi:hypothetical protein